MILAEETNVFPRLLDHAYPSVERGQGIRLYTTDGDELLDAGGECHSQPGAHLVVDALGGDRALPDLGWRGVEARGNHYLRRARGA